MSNKSRFKLTLSRERDERGPEHVRAAAQLRYHRLVGRICDWPNPREHALE